MNRIGDEGGPVKDHPRLDDLVASQTELGCGVSLFSESMR